ncbi:outer membrane beta-barrel family protein [soil metagenome]
MKRSFLLFAGLLFCIFSSAAIQSEFSLSGRVLDAEQKPVPYAVVSLIKAEDSTLVKGVIADEMGNFSFENNASGKFLLQINATGFSQTFYGPFDFAGDQKMTLPDVVLVAPKEMKEVEITAIQQLYIQKADMLIMNVENSPVKISGTAWDLLSTVPGVVVDQSGKITLRGKSGVLIYMDGKNTFLAGDQLQSYLQGISAADVTQIQIISNPSAKYDAQGSGGILNIITRKGSQQGFNGAVRAGFGQAFYSKYNGGFNFNYAKEKFNVYGRYDAYNWNNIERAYLNRNVTYNGSTTNFNQHNSTISVPYGQNARLGIDFYAKHDITWGGRVDGGLSTGKDKTVNSTMISVSGNDSTNELYQRNTNDSRFKNGSANLYFKQQYDTNGRELSASMDYLTYTNNEAQTFNLNYFDQSGNTSAPAEDQRSKAISNIRILVGQVDYSHPFSNKYKMELGIKSSYVETENNLNFDVLNNTAWENDTTRSNAFTYKENINAAYVTGYADYGKFQVTGGLRAEQTLSEGVSPTTGDQLKRSYLQLFPSIFILQKLAKNHALNFTYARRVNRPGYQDLNPFTFYLDKYTFRKGNPFLQPEISNNAELSYSFMEALYVTVGASRTKHAMTDVTNQIDSTGVGYQTTVNLNNVDNVYFGFNTPIPIGNWFMAELQLSESYNKYTSVLFDGQYDNKSWMFNASTTLTFSLPKTLKIQTWVWYQSPGVYGVFHMRSQGGSGASVSKSFLNKQLSMTLAIYDIFQTSGLRAYINYQNQDAYISFIPETPRVFLRARYTFGNTKATRKAQDKSGADDLQNRTGK